MSISNTIWIRKFRYNYPPKNSNKQNLPENSNFCFRYDKIYDKVYNDDGRHVDANYGNVVVFWKKWPVGNCSVLSVFPFCTSRKKCFSSWKKRLLLRNNALLSEKMYACILSNSMFHKRCVPHGGGGVWWWGWGCSFKSNFICIKSMS